MINQQMKIFRICNSRNVFFSVTNTFWFIKIKHSSLMTFDDIFDELFIDLLIGNIYDYQGNHLLRIFETKILYIISC